ncbi:MAG: hypothetical protein ACNI3A_10215 [Desulfovibrio sp.]|uniref:hypothetical protein n=1 Tax=Desulfovibrio sp. 7SRBS1 TaxID=3378064 RepID=UPI003B4205E1
MDAEKNASGVADLFFKIALALALGWLMVMGFQGYIWMRTDNWMPIPFGNTEYSLTGILAVGAVVFYLLRWAVDRIPKRSPQDKSGD